KAVKILVEWLSAYACCHSVEISILAFTEILNNFFHFFFCLQPGLHNTAPRIAKDAAQTDTGALGSPQQPLAIRTALAG
ncbi:MAG: hypothetical protein PVG47_08740, partial [Chromatiales bacterium]